MEIISSGSLDTDLTWDKLREDVRKILNLECVAPQDIPYLPSRPYYQRKEIFERCKSHLGEMCGYYVRLDENLDLSMYSLGLAYLCEVFNFKDD